MRDGQVTRDGSADISPTGSPSWIVDADRKRGPFGVTRRRRMMEAALADGMTLRLPAGPEAASEGRAALMRLRADLDKPLLETLRLLVTELIANSVRHASANTVGLRALVGESGVWVEVTDEGPGFDPRDHDHTVSDDSGWGLFLVERLADRWGVRRDGDSTRVWFELRRS
ncbi:MAG: ATP-binding protein [Thermoleophilaceae bacterium]